MVWLNLTESWKLLWSLSKGNWFTPDDLWTQLLYWKLHWPKDLGSVESSLFALLIVSQWPRTHHMWIVLLFDTRLFYRLETRLNKFKSFTSNKILQPNIALTHPSKNPSLIELKRDDQEKKLWVVLLFQQKDSDMFPQIDSQGGELHWWS